MTMHYIDASCPLRDWPRTQSGSQPEGVSALVRRLLTAEQRRRTPRAPVKSRAA